MTGIRSTPTVAPIQPNQVLDGVRIMRNPTDMMRMFDNQVQAKHSTHFFRPFDSPLA
jgi:hypothetical protein